MSDHEGEDEEIKTLEDEVTQLEKLRSRHKAEIKELKQKLKSNRVVSKECEDTRDGVLKDYNKIKAELEVSRV